MDSEEPGSPGFPRRAGRAGEEEGRGGVVAGWERKGMVRKGEYRDGGWWLGDDGFVDGGFGNGGLEMVGCECCIGNGSWNLNNRTFLGWCGHAFDPRETRGRPAKNT